jgi:dTMP kinase
MYKNPHPGKFIVIEGIDGAGSSTQTERVASYFKEIGKKFHITKEPTNSLIGGLIRGQLTSDWKSSPECLQLLFSADRAHHLEKEIIPLLEKGVSVISDRYFFSTIAFGAMEVKNKDWLLQINEPFMLPDLIFLLKISPETAAKRIKDNRFSVELFEKKEKLAKTWQNYQKLAKEFKNVCIIDGEKTIQEISYEIVNKVKRIL